MPWKANHKAGCKEPSYYAVRERACMEDRDGNVLDADPSDGKMVHADCSECGARAEWVKDTESILGKYAGRGIW
ncbi:hypothetical protein LCGC14_2995860, partial [marine sediment metagenome]